MYVVNTAVNAGIKASNFTPKLIYDIEAAETDALLDSAIMGTKFDPYSQVGVMVGSDIAFYYGMNSGSNQAELFNASNNKAGVDSQASENETGLHRSIKLGVSDFTSTKLESEGVLSAEASSAPDQQALYATKVKSLGLSTDISESQWIQSAMGYNRDTTAFNYTQNATSMPSMQLDYSRFMDSVMTATQPTQKYPAYAASNPSSVQPTSQGVGVRKASGSVLSSWLKSHTGDPIQLATDAVNYYVDHQQQIDATLERFTDPVLKPVERLLAPVLQAGAEGLDWFNDTMVNPMMPVLTSEGLGSLPDAIEYLTVALSKAATSLRELSGIESELAGGVSSTADV